MKKIGMVVAMQKELLPFIGRQNGEIKKEKVKGFDVVSFKVGENVAYCARSGIGEIFAAAATQMLISEYDVDVIINFGVCGSLRQGVSLKTVVAVKGVVHYDFDLTAIDDLDVGVYPGSDGAVISTDRTLLEKVTEVAPDIPCVICASADKFVSDEKAKKYLRDTFSADICEMESAGVLITARNAAKPCLIIKAVSDGEGGAEEFAATVNEASKIYIDLINEISASL